MTVIYSDFGDKDTEVLKGIWGGLDVNLVHLTKDSEITQDQVDDAISTEEDTIIFCGHGSPSGCWNPCGGYTISEENLDCLKAKTTIGIWCYASEFMKEFNIRGFSSYMFISNPMEAARNSIRGISYEDITESEVKFCKMLNNLLKDGVPLRKWKEIILSKMDEDNPVEYFNYTNTQLLLKTSEI